MPIKRKKVKNRKLKSKMKGGDGTAPAAEAGTGAGAEGGIPSWQQDFVQKPKPMGDGRVAMSSIEKPKNRNARKKEAADKKYSSSLRGRVASRAAAVGAGISSYNKYSDSIYINGISAVGVVGFVWMMVSRSLIRHKYSEALSYGLLEIAVSFSVFLIFFKGVRIASKSMVSDMGILAAIKEIMKLVTFVLKRCIPGLLIMVQLAVLIWLMYEHADYLYQNENMPRMFGIFNAMTIAMIMGQCWVWKDKVLLVMSSFKGKATSQSPLQVPGFILAAILSGVAISQMWVILEYLNVDC